MKQNLSVVAVFIVGMFVLSGCASMMPVGLMYTDVSVPNGLGDGNNVSYSKVGTAKATSIINWFATGDASIDAAVKNGNIKSIKYVDYHAKSVLGLFSEYTTTVYGD